MESESTETATPGDALTQLLTDRFGFASFRDGQRAVIEPLLSQRSVVAVMPTGAGKSLTYQLPALLLPGVALIVSPLIALMKDQVDSLRALGIPASCLNSSQSRTEQEQTLTETAQGRCKILFVAPERFRNERFLAALPQMQISLLAVDEAHCISEWGHDFRPDYLALGEVRRLLGDPVTLALTATATPEVQQDIRRQLRLDQAQTLVTGFGRPNLFLEVYQAPSKRDKIWRIRNLLRQTAGSCIIYCATRKAVEDVAGTLRRHGEVVGVYHGGLTSAQRVAVQDDFMDGCDATLVATNAFGMGVDKPDIRAIVHFEFPGSLEAYYQEAGRAGRDGKPARCLLLYNYADRRIHDLFLENGHPEKAALINLWEKLRLLGVGVHALDNDGLPIDRNVGTRSHAFSGMLNHLEQAVHLRRHPGNPGRLELFDTVPAKYLRIDWDNLARRRKTEEARLWTMIRFASGHRCRTETIMRYFGADDRVDRCGHCDVCAPEQVTPESEAPRQTAARQPAWIPDDALTASRKITACIARCRQRETTQTIARVLVGSKATALTRRGFDRLSTHGIMSYFKLQPLQELLTQLTRHGFLALRGSHLTLTDAAVAVMKGDGQLPEGIAELFPPTRNERVRTPAKTPDKDAAAGTPQSAEQTLSLLRQGISASEVAKRRGLTRQTIMRHLLIACEEGRAAEIDLRRAIDPEILEAVRAAAALHDWHDGFRALLDDVNRRCGKARITHQRLKEHLALLLQQATTPTF